MGGTPRSQLGSIQTGGGRGLGGETWAGPESESAGPVKCIYLALWLMHVSVWSTEAKVNTLGLFNTSLGFWRRDTSVHTHPMVPYLPASCEMVTDTSRPNVVTLLHTASMSMMESMLSGPSSTQHWEPGQKRQLSSPL